jgi:hypothetical protein
MDMDGGGGGGQTVIKYKPTYRLEPMEDRK